MGEPSVQTTCPECGDDEVTEGLELCLPCQEIRAYEDHLARKWES